MPKTASAGAMLVAGFRPGTIFRTAHGPYRNGSKPSKAQLDYLKSVYEVVPARPNEVEPEALQSQSTMRQEQIDDASAKRAGADQLADDAASRAAATRPTEE